MGQNIDLGPSCFIGSDANPIVLHPANTDVSNAMLDFVMFDPDGTPNPNGPLSALVVSNTTQGDSTFAVPGVTGCGPNGDGSLDAVVNAVVGLPSPAGANNLVLEDAGSALALPATGMSGAEFAAAWHSAFDRLAVMPGGAYAPPGMHAPPGGHGAPRGRFTNGAPVRPFPSRRRLSE